MKPVPLLARIRVATPCRADWNEMTGDARVRHCAHCDKDVFNLSAMSREQAEALIIAKNGDLCARYYQRHDGTILLADCSVGIRQKDRSRTLAAGVAALLGGSVAGSYLALRHRDAPIARIEDRATEVELLEVQPPPPPPPPSREVEKPREVLGGMPDVRELERPAIPEPLRPHVKAR